MEIGTPFDDTCDNLLLFIVQKRTIAPIPKNFAFKFLTTKQGTPNLKGVIPYTNISICLVNCLTYANGKW